MQKINLFHLKRLLFFPLFKLNNEGLAKDIDAFLNYELKYRLYGRHISQFLDLIEIQLKGSL